MVPFVNMVKGSTELCARSENRIASLTLSRVLMLGVNFEFIAVTVTRLLFGHCCARNFPARYTYRVRQRKFIVQSFENVIIAKIPEENRIICFNLVKTTQLKSLSRFNCILYRKLHGLRSINEKLHACLACFVFRLALFDFM